ncbi:hypothetical protein [[Bacillus] enclensis]|uniref:hypothetical protein n=1 Tax=[Bacillus] enclensis TaxID=1402860 RepID=UPI0018DE1CC3|nr:hypothetical protein [[Bacillus] enclensis]MBH9965262.1 hypothetical protein [[Bacillus] enclensis]
MWGVILIIVHAISLTLALAVFLSVYRNNPVKGKLFLAAIMLWGLFSLYKLFIFSTAAGVLSIFMYAALSTITFRELKRNGPAA